MTPGVVEIALRWPSADEHAGGEPVTLTLTFDGRAPVVMTEEDWHKLERAVRSLADTAPKHLSSYPASITRRIDLDGGGGV